MLQCVLTLCTSTNNKTFAFKQWLMEQLNLPFHHWLPLFFLSINAFLHPPCLCLSFVSSFISSLVSSSFGFRSLMMLISRSSAVWWWMTLSVCWTTSPSGLVSPTWCFRLSWCCWRRLRQRSECICTLYTCCYCTAVIKSNDKTQTKNECVLLTSVVCIS